MNKLEHRCSDCFLEIRYGLQLNSLFERQSVKTKIGDDFIAQSKNLDVLQPTSKKFSI